MNNIPKPWDQPMSQSELERVAKLSDVQVIFDVGVRTSLDYLQIFPNATYHLFEPDPKFNVWLVEETKYMPNITVNCYGLGDIPGDYHYGRLLQTFEGGEAGSIPEIVLPIKTLDWYIKENNIDRIDFLKIDCEGYDYKVLKGGKKAVKLARHIQYEHWDNLAQFHNLLEKDFEMEYIGERNVFCTRR